MQERERREAAVDPLPVQPEVRAFVQVPCRARAARLARERRVHDNPVAGGERRAARAPRVRALLSSGFRVQGLGLGCRIKVWGHKFRV